MIDDMAATSVKSNVQTVGQCSLRIDLCQSARLRQKCNWRILRFNGDLPSSLDARSSAQVTLANLHSLRRATMQPLGLCRCGHLLSSLGSNARQQVASHSLPLTAAGIRATGLRSVPIISAPLHVLRSLTTLSAVRVHASPALIPRAQCNPLLAASNSSLRNFAARLQQQQSGSIPTATSASHRLMHTLGNATQSLHRFTTPHSRLIHPLSASLSPLLSLQRLGFAVSVFDPVHQVWRLTHDDTSPQEQALRRQQLAVLNPDSPYNPALEQLPPQRDIGRWLFVLCGLVFVMVVVGGLTRLTRSGLSMVEWKPTTAVPPMTDAEWHAEFEKYKLYPEYKLRQLSVDAGSADAMTLSEFKFIYMMEWSHRQLGRFIGLAFALPCLYFGTRTRISWALLRRLTVCLALGGSQAAIGWWMVKSGLEKTTMKTTDSGQVHVSPYRLASHLCGAFVIYVLLLRTALQIHTPQSASFASLARTVPQFKQLRVSSAATAALVLLTVVSGAFVAGNEAGLVYNEFPLMGGRFVPSDYINPHLHPAWRNAFENSSAVQFHHRVLALSSVAAITGLFLFVRRPAIWNRLPLKSHTAAKALVGVAYAQASLGITTLLLYVPVPLASLHQAGSLTLLTLSIYFHHCIPSGRVLNWSIYNLGHSQYRVIAQSFLWAGCWFALFMGFTALTLKYFTVEPVDITQGKPDAPFKNYKNTAYLDAPLHANMDAVFAKKRDYVKLLKPNPLAPPPDYEDRYSPPASEQKAQALQQTLAREAQFTKDYQKLLSLSTVGPSATGDHPESQEDNQNESQ